jgi:putative ABC transport system permease protein
VKYLPLVWSGLWRKRVRTVLTMICVAIAFLLFGILSGITSAFDLAIDRYTDASRLRTQSRHIHMATGLPVAHLARIESVPGVRGVGFYNFFDGYFQEPANNINAYAIDVSRRSALASSLMNVIVPDEQIETMKRTRTGVIIGTELVERYGWKIGDRVTLKSTLWTRKDGSSDWDFDIVGVYELPKGGFPENDGFWINNDYFDEARAFGNGSVSTYSIVVDDVDRAAQIAADIDRLFANSPDETRTQSERDTIRAQIDRIGNIGYIVNAIISAVLFALFFVTGNTMMQSIRERIPELAVLKTYGFGDGALAGLVVVEASLLCVTAALIGLGVAAYVFPRVFDSLGIAALPLESKVIVNGLAFAFVLALASALPPAWRAQRLKIVDALAGR